MAVNPSPSKLDQLNMAQRSYDEANDSIRVELGANSGVSLQLDAATDSISVQGVSSSTKVSLTNASTGVVIPAASCVGTQKFQLYSHTNTTITDSQVCTVEVSPSDTDNVWVATSLTNTPDTTAGNSVMGTAVTNIVARRARVSIAAAITSGTFDLYLVKQG